MTYTDVEVSVGGVVVVVVVDSPGRKGLGGGEKGKPRAGDGLMVGRGWEGEKSVKAAL